MNNIEIFRTLYDQVDALRQSQPLWWSRIMRLPVVSQAWGRIQDGRANIATITNVRAGAHNAVLNLMLENYNSRLASQRNRANTSAPTPGKENTSGGKISTTKYMPRSTKQLSAWNEFVKKYKADHPELSFKQVLKEAAPEYRKQKGSS